jgi:DNA-binding CsgD family transcriptional regulator
MPRELRTDSDQNRRRELLAVRFERDALAAVLDYFPLGVVVLGPQLEPIQMNRAARELLDADASASGSPAEVIRGGALPELIATIKDTIEGSDGEEPVRYHTISIQRHSMKHAFEMLLVSLEPQKDQEWLTVVFLCDTADCLTTDPEMLQQMYGMTPTEARVASEIVTGRSMEEIAGELEIELSTARSHLKRVFHKTDTHSQTDLVRLLMRGLSRLSMGEEGRKVKGEE